MGKERVGEGRRGRGGGGEEGEGEVGGRKGKEKGRKRHILVKQV